MLQSTQTTKKTETQKSASPKNKEAKLQQSNFDRLVVPLDEESSNNDSRATTEELRETSKTRKSMFDAA